MKQGLRWVLWSSECEMSVFVCRDVLFLFAETKMGVLICANVNFK